jgi:hypothetical protein
MWLSGNQNDAFDPEQTSDIRSHFSGSKGRMVLAHCGADL